MKKLLFLILTIIVPCCCFSCSSTKVSCGFLISDFKTNTGLYLGVKASENQKDISLSIFFGNNFYNDDNFLSSPGSEENRYVISIRFINDENIKTFFDKEITDFSQLKYDCVSSGKLLYKETFDFSIKKVELGQEGTIEIALSSFSTTDDSFCEVYQKIKYRKGEKLVIQL